MKAERLAPIAAVLGLALIVASWIWPSVAQRGPGGWTEEKAQQHAKTRAELHAATHAHDEGHNHGHGDAARARDLQERFNAELAELDAARNRGETGARWLWWSGVSLVVVGALVYFLRGYS